MPTKHIILIHGRSSKPIWADQFALVKQALLSRLDQVNPAAAASIRTGKVKLSFAYYGDVLNTILKNSDPKLKDENRSYEEKGIRYVNLDPLDKSIAVLVARSNDRHQRQDYKRLVKQFKGRRWQDDLARWFSKPLSFLGLSGRLILSKCPDIKKYLKSHKTGSDIRNRLQPILENAFRSDEDVALVSHSMGCMVAYDVLWKYSRMSEYWMFRKKKISLWMTLGNPLGEPAIRKMLFDAREDDEDQYPNNIRRWVNFTARDDFVAHDRTVADDFHEMVDRGLVERIEDVSPIYTFWVGDNGSNPHKFYGYLNHPEVAKRLGDWITE